MKHRILSLLVALCLIASLLPMSVLAASYTDTDGHWAESSIERWSDAGVVQGTGDAFAPDSDLTCAQLATILAKLLRLPAADDAGFSDNLADAWYYDAINRCAAAGILNGYADGTVRPNETIRRARAMVMLARALGIEPAGTSVLNGYADAANVPDWARGYVAALLRADIVSGVSGSRLAALANITRAQFVTILDRAIAIYADEDGATVKADDVDGIIVVVAEDVQIKNAPAGTKVVAAASAKSLKVNGKSVDADQVHTVPETVERPKSAGHAHTHEYTIFETDWSTMTTVKRCACGATETVEDSSTYYIANAEDLKAFRDKVNSDNTFAGKTIRLTANIDLNNEEWTPIGTSTYPFKGVFDGRANTISNYQIKAQDNDGSGLFGVIEGSENSNFTQLSDVVSGNGSLSTKNITEDKYTCVVKNLTVSGVTVDANGEHKYVSPVIGAASNAYIDAVHVENTKMTVYKYGAGTVAKLARGVVTGCTTADTCTFTGGASGGHIAGMVASVDTGLPFVVMNCTNNAAIEAKYGRNGGIVALSSSAVAAINCVNNGSITVEGAHNAAGIAGQAPEGEYINCVNKGPLSGSVRSGDYEGFGGIAAYASGTSRFFNCENSNAITATGGSFVGGICGKTSPASQFTNCRNNADVTWSGNDAGYAYPITAGVIGTEEAAEMTFAELKNAVEKSNKQKIVIKNITISDTDNLGVLVLPANCTNIESTHAICAKMDLSNCTGYVSINVPGTYELTNCPNIAVTVSNAEVTVTGTTNGGVFKIIGSNAGLTISEGCTIARVEFNGTGTYTLTNNGSIKNSNYHVVTTESACNLTVTNNGTISTDNSDKYAMLFYGNSTVTVHQKGTVTARDGKIIIAWNGSSQKAESAIYRVYENGTLTKSWQVAANPWQELSSLSEEP